MWWEWLVKALGTAIISVTGTALAAWALSHRKPKHGERRQGDTKRPDRSITEPRADSLHCSSCGVGLTSPGEPCPECGRRG